ncbi:MAG: CotH kinase family protein, partial [Clostridia bacterium]|nr:CotH kinase family protein [Clostridia bacterium]
LFFHGFATLHFSSPIDFGENTITFSSKEKGNYFVKTSLGTQISASSVIFLSPLSNLIWEGEGTIPALSSVEKFSNLKKYNGEDFLLGGDGAAIPSLHFSAEENDFLEDDISFQAKGNLLVSSLPFSLSKKDLNEAVFSLTCENGSVHLEGEISSGVVVTKDKFGKERKFKVEAERDALNIPVIHIETESGAEIISKSEYVSATFAFDSGSSEYESVKETHIRIRGRGNSTWKWEKKPYKIHFDEPTSLLGLPKAEEWALISCYADKSLMRNHLAQTMASTLSFEYCPTQVYVDLFLNGEYLGVYTFGEHLEAGDGRVEVKYDPGAIDCGYFLEAGGVVSGVDIKGMNYFHAGLVKFVLIKSPDYTTLTSQQFNFIKNYMLKANEAVKNKEGYEEYLDMTSLVDWMIMTELSCNTDCSWRRSTYLTKDPGGKLVMGPVWDFDLAFGNFSKDNPGYDTWVSTEPEDDYVGETWSTYLLEDPKFQKAFKKRWQEVSENLINTALAEIDKDYEILLPSAEENFKRWDILGRKVAFERHDTTEYKTYSSQIYYLKDFLVERAAWIDAQVENW